MVRMFIIYDDNYAVLGLVLEGRNYAIAIKTAGFVCYVCMYVYTLEGKIQTQQLFSNAFAE